MKKIISITIFLIIFQIVGCATSPQYQSSPSSKMARETLHTSLFEDDKSIISDEAVAKILDSKIEIMPDNMMAVYKLDNRVSGINKYYGYNYWLSEEYLDLQQRYFQIVKTNLIGNGKIRSVKSLPSILTPSKLNISKLRESAVRMQANLLVVYSIQSDIFEEIHLFKANEVKAYSTCEMILFDTRTGIVPFSEVITKKYKTQKLESDANIRETRKRAEQEAILETLNELSSKLGVYIKNG